MVEHQSVTAAGNGRNIVVVGAGGHAKVIIDCLRSAGWNVIGCTDADPSPRNCAGIPVLGSDEELYQLRADGIAHAFCALGNNAIREGLTRKLIEIGFDLPAVQGPGSVISSSVRIGMGAAILPGAVVNVDSLVGDFAIINTGAMVDHDGVIGRAAHIGPGAALAGQVEVGDRAFVATGCSIIPQRKIGSDTVVGAGSVVVQDIPSGVLAFGNPARVRRAL